MYSGYLGKGQAFYWLFRNTDVSKPLVLYLTNLKDKFLTQALMDEGPLEININGHKFNFNQNPNSILNSASILYIDFNT